jgi:hypothetical protein
MSRGFEDRQADLEKHRYKARLLTHFRKRLRGTATVKGLSYLVIGERRRLKGRQPHRVELAFIIYVHTDVPIPGALQGDTILKRGNRFTFVQAANSVKTNSFTTAFTAQYTGRDPPTLP